MLLHVCSGMSDSFWPHGTSRFFFPWDRPGKNTGVGCHYPLQGICPTQGLIPVSCIGQKIFTTEPPGKPFDLLCACTQLLCRVQLCSSMDCSHQAPLFMEFSRQEYWSSTALNFISFSLQENLKNVNLRFQFPLYEIPFELCMHTCAYFIFFKLNVAAEGHNVSVIILSQLLSIYFMLSSFQLGFSTQW